MGHRHDLAVAFMFLTRLPIRTTTPWASDDLAGSVVMFPLVGAVVGGLTAAAFGAMNALGLPPLLAGALATACLILMTGALHEDGLADIADGFGGGRSKEDKLRIMQDSRLGSYGTLALILSLILRVGALAELAEPWLVAAALIAMGALSRSLMPPAMILMEKARPDGLAAKVGRPHPGRALAGLVAALAITGLCLPLVPVLVLIVTTLLAAGLLLALARRQIGGITGDVLGALQQITEIIGLLTLVALGVGGPH